MKVFFIDLPLINLSSQSNDDKNYLNFFLSEFQNKKNIVKDVYHNNKNYNDKINYNSLSIFKIKNFNKIFYFMDLLKFFLFYFYFSLIALILLPFRQEFAILLKEIFEAFIFYLNKKNYSKIYLFNNARGIYRPVWTYIKKEKNFKCFFSFDSMYCKPFNHDDDYFKKFNLYFAANYGGIEYLNWDMFYFWNQYQKNFFEKRLINKNYNFKILKPINISGLNYIPKKNSNLKVAFFDIPPFSLAYSVYRHPPLFYTFKNLTRTFEDIINISRKYDFELIYKFKRYVPEHHDKKYIHWIENYVKKQPNVTFVDNTISVTSMLNNVNSVIGMPFTAAAIIAKSLKKNSIYYDKSNFKYNEALAYDNIQIIKNKVALEKWIKKRLEDFNGQQSNLHQF